MKIAARFAALALVLAACHGAKDEKPKVQTVGVERRNIVVSAEATGAVEPINIVEVKSKASGLITEMPVETGTQVKPGDLLVQVDTRDVQNQYEQAAADLRAAEASLSVAKSQQKRSDDLFSQRIITAEEHETASLAFANAQAQVVRSRASLDLAKQRLEDATIRAPVAGTVIEKDVARGTVITSATGAFGGGTTLLKMADLTQVRVRALVNETDIGQVQSGQQATVTVDAYPDRPFHGTVDRIEPQAVVQQSVTMFPVLVNVSNREGLLMPGMNGEVQILIQERDNVLAIPNDAIRTPREAATSAEVLGLDPAAVQKQLQEQYASLGINMGRGGMRGMGGPGGRAQVSVSRGDVDLQQPQQGAQRGQRQQLPQVSEKQCADVTAALAKHPALKTTLDSLRSAMQAGQVDRQAMMAATQKAYKDAGIDPLIVRACRAQQRESSGGQQGTAGRQAGAPLGAPELPGQGAHTQPGLVFVASGTTYQPRVVRLGVSNFDYTEVLSGVKEGDQVALLTAASLQAQRQQNIDRARARSSPVPGGGGRGGRGR